MKGRAVLVLAFLLGAGLLVLWSRRREPVSVEPRDSGGVQTTPTRELENEQHAPLDSAREEVELSAREPDAPRGNACVLSGAVRLREDESPVRA